MSLFKPTPQENFDTPSQLATELAGHKNRYEKGRQNVLDRGTARVAELTELQRQVEVEREAHEDLLKAA